MSGLSCRVDSRAIINSLSVSRHPLLAVRRSLFATALILLPLALPSQALPSTLDGWPVIELTRTARPNGETWVGTYGHGVLVQPSGGGMWRRIQSDTSATSLSWDFVHAIAFGPRDQVWVGTIGNGWGLSRDDGRTWKNWTFSRARSRVAIRGAAGDRHRRRHHDHRHGRRNAGHRRRWGALGGACGWRGARREGTGRHGKGYPPVGVPHLA